MPSDTAQPADLARLGAGRSRRRTWVAAAVAALLTACNSPKTPEPAPNVLVVVVDCLRADRVGGAPGETLTPNLDQLAADGIGFTQAFSAASWTKPSIGSLFTALYPGQHGLRRVAFDESEQLSTDVLPAELETMAEIFQRRGYATGAVVNQVHLQPKFGFDQGFEDFLAVRGKPAGWLNRRLLAWLENHQDGQPFFAYLHYLDVHWPYTSGSARRGIKQWQLGPAPPRDGNRAQDWIDSFELRTRDEAAQELAGLYDQEVRFIDRQIGKLLHDLSTLDASRNTIILVTSDHGEGFYEHHRLQHGYAPFEEVIHVPLVIHLPGARHAGSTITEPVSLVDVLPTLAELADLDAPASIAGRSLVPLWQSRPGRWRPRALFAEGGGNLAVRYSEFKLIAGPDSSDYYDLRADRREQSPLDRRRCGTSCDQLDQALGAYQSAGEEVAAGEAVTFTGEEIEELKELGYL